MVALEGEPEIREHIPALTTDANPNFDPKASGGVQTAIHNVNLVLESSQAAASDPPSELPALHRVTPLIRSEILSERTGGHNVWLKLDALQPSGSFKIRGIGRVCSLAYARYGKQAHLVTSSGGNAGLAAATACKTLGLKCTVFVPTSCEDSVVKLLRQGLGAVVNIGGDAWDACDQKARELVRSEAGAVYVHPFVGEDLLDGHASLPHEIYQQLAESNVASPDMIICTVGGGGLIQGILRGLSQIERNAQTSGKDYRPPVIVATQDFGADSFSQSMNLYFQDPIANKDAHVVLPAITSKATSMGAKRCSETALRDARAYAERGSVSSSSSAHTAREPINPYLSTVIMDDAIAASSCWQFKRDHDILVELSCGAALAPIYQSDRVLPKLIERGDNQKRANPLNIVVVVCGGSKVDSQMLAGYERDFGDMSGRGEIKVDGQAA